MMKVLFYADPTRLYETFARSADVLADHRRSSGLGRWS